MVASKYFTIPWTNMLLGGGFRFGAQAMSDALNTSLQRLGADQVDLYQVHFPFPTYPQEVSLRCALLLCFSSPTGGSRVCVFDRSD